MDRTRRSFITCAWLAEKSFCKPGSIYSCVTNRFGQCERCHRACDQCGSNSKSSITASASSAITTSTISTVRSSGSSRGSIKGRTTEAIFSDIYQNKRWTAAGKGSGAGSTFASAVGASHIITHLALSLNATRMVDAPCGGMLWQESMILFLRANIRGFTFHGVDVVGSVVDANRQHFAGKQWVTFAQVDLVDEPLPRRFDLAFCRDALMHNMEGDVLLILYNLALSARFIAAGSYGCTTNPRRGKCSNHAVNRPVGTSNSSGATGGFFVIDLMQPPYSLVPWRTFSENDPTNKVFYLFRQQDLLAQLKKHIAPRARSHIEGPEH